MVSFLDLYGWIEEVRVFDPIGAAFPFLKERGNVDDHRSVLHFVLESTSFLGLSVYKRL